MMTTHPSTPTASKRIATIDVMRAIIMLLMLFVNDIPGVDGLPHWLGHAETEEDMLGFSDIVFPGFLFCVGMSIPFAMQSRLRKTAGNVLGVLRHVLDRTVALVVMGLFTLNACKTGLFMLLMTVGFFLVWLNYDKRSRDAQRRAAKGAQGLGHCAAVCHHAPLRCHWQTLPHWLVGHIGANWLGLLGVGSALSAHTLTLALHPLRMGCRGAALHHQRPRWHHSRAVFQSQHILAVLAWWLDSPCAGDVGHGGIAAAAPHGHQPLSTAASSRCSWQWLWWQGCVRSSAIIFGLFPKTSPPPHGFSSAW